MVALIASISSGDIEKYDVSSAACEADIRV